MKMVKEISDEINLDELIKNKRVTVIVKVNSPKSEIIEYDPVKGTLKLNIHAVPEKGKANLEIVKFFKKNLKKDVKIVSGFKSKEKVIEFL